MKFSVSSLFHSFQNISWLCDLKAKRQLLMTELGKEDDNVNIVKKCLLCY